MTSVQVLFYFAPCGSAALPFCFLCGPAALPLSFIVIQAGQDPGLDSRRAKEKGPEGPSLYAYDLRLSRTCRMLSARADLIWRSRSFAL